MAESSVDVLIVGAGPVGLFGAYYAGVRGLSTAVLDSLPEPGGQITAMYPEKAIFDVAGFPAVRGRELVSNLVAQAAPFSPGKKLGLGDEVANETCSGLSGSVTDLPRIGANRILQDCRNATAADFFISVT